MTNGQSSIAEHFAADYIKRDRIESGEDDVGSDRRTERRALNASMADDAVYDKCSRPDGQIDVRNHGCKVGVQLEFVDSPQAAELVLERACYCGEKVGFEL